jgi:HD-GYP domain-containing protein (c-di-GMP phosphodiesterase class II)
MDFPARSNTNHPSLWGARESSSVRESLFQWWSTNQLWISWTLLAVPIALEIIYGTHLFPYLILAPVTLGATYLIYRNTSARLRAKTDEITALGNLHLATAEALATAIDAKDQTTHCHVRRVQIYAAGMGALFDLSPNEIAALPEQAWSTDAG